MNGASTRHAGALVAAALMLPLAWLPAVARADGFSELKAMLARPAAASPLKGTLRVESSSRQGDDKEADEDHGQATLDFEDGPAGLRIAYSRELLARVEQETRARDKDPKAKTPAASGLRAADPSALRSMLAPNGGLLALLDECAPKGEIAEPWNGRPARHLSCEYGLAKLKGKDRKYVKTYEGKVEVWVGAGGVPLAASVETRLTGRAFVVISFETASHLEQTFQMVGERLITLREERRSSGSGAGEKGESRTVRELLPLP